MTDYSKEPLSGVAGAFWKFVISAIFGAMISAMFYGIVFIMADENSFWFEKGLHIFWIIPLTWGLLGIFWFEKMLTVARDVVETAFGYKA